MPTIDFSQIHQNIPAGTYRAAVVAAVAGLSNQGFPKIDLRWKILEGQFEGRVVFDTLPFHPNALWRTKAALLGLGFDSSFSGEIEPDDLVGKEASIEVIIESSNAVNPTTGQPYEARNRVKKVLPQSTGVEDLLS